MQIQQLLSEDADQKLPPIYRGVEAPDTKVGDVVSITVQPNRPPVASTLTGAALFDRGIELKFGIVGVRKNAVFATTDYQFAGEYAENYGNRGRVLQLMLNPGTQILLNPDIDDSIAVTSGDDADAYRRMMDELFELIGKPGVYAWAWYKQFERTLTKEQYLAMDARSLMMHAFSNKTGLNLDQETCQEALEMFDRYALENVNGYKLINSESFTVGKNPFQGVELIIIGLKSFSGVVVE